MRTLEGSERGSFGQGGGLGRRGLKRVRQERGEEGFGSDHKGKFEFEGFGRRRAGEERKGEDVEGRGSVRLILIKPAEQGSWKSEPSESRSSHQ